MINTIKLIFKSYIKTVWINKFLFILLFWIFVAFIGVVEPLIFTQIIKKIETFYQTWEFDRNWTILFIIYWWVFILFTIIIQYIYDYFLVWKTTNKNYVDECNKYAKKIISMDYWTFLWKKQGSLYKIFDRGTDQHIRFLFFFFWDIIKSLSGIVIILAILFYIDLKMTLITISMLPIMIWLGVFFLKKVWPYQKELNNKWDSVFALVWNILSSFWLTKTLTLESSYLKDIKNRLSNIYTDQIKVNKFWSINTIYTWMLVMISRILVLWFWVFYVINWDLSFANLFLFFAYIGWIYFPLGYLFGRFRELTEQITAVEKLHNEFDNLERELLNKWKNIKNIKWNIEFKNVNFWYNQEKSILNWLNFSIKPWEKVAFVWNTGAWKSTIVNLLLRFWDTKTWDILIDGKSIYNYSKKSLRDNIWIVTQDVSLFNDTIKNNLLFANPKAKKKDLENAINKAEASYIFDLKDGIETVIWERWMKLSGWEKQRLAIARLFLKNPKILILDEATSALDNKTEVLVQKALDKLMKSRTSIVVAHRLSTIQNSDKIFMLEKWNIIESWNYEYLINKKSSFYKLANPKHLILN